MKKQIHLSTAERVILSNQFRIMEHLSRLLPGESDERSGHLSSFLEEDHDYLLRAHVVECGIASHYDTILPDDWEDEEIGSDIHIYVEQILKMFKMIAESIPKLGSKHQSTDLAKRLRYRGFDNTYDPKHSRMANFLLTTAEYGILSETCLGRDSHKPTQMLYEAMLEAFKARKNSWALSLEDLERIAEAADEADL